VSQTGSGGTIRGLIDVFSENSCGRFPMQLQDACSSYARRQTDLSSTTVGCEP